MNYTSFFNFYFHIPIAVFFDSTYKEIATEIYSMQAIPIVCITDTKHPLHRQYTKMFKSQGITEPIKAIVLSVGYNNQFLS